MSNNNQIPWKIIIPAIVVILAAIIGATWASWLNPPPSDFCISVNPMKGEVHQGGVITTAITIKGIQEYEHPVSLSASGLPSGIVVTFIPSIGGPTPSYTSNVMLSVDSSVPVGIYTIIIKGTGADGKEHSCNYILTVVTPMSVTPTPTLAITPTPTPTPSIKPTIKLDYSEVSNNAFKGHIVAKNLKDDTGYALCIHGKPNKSGNEKLKEFNEPKNEGGYLDFDHVLSDSFGKLDKNINATLPEGTYDAKFLIKELPGHECIAAYESLKFEIHRNNVTESYKEVFMKILN